MRDVLLYSKAIANLIPNVGFSIDADDYSSLRINGEVNTPLESDIDAEYERLLLDYNSKEYQRLRKPEYPELADFADAYYWAQQGDNTKMDEYLAKIQAIKEKYPKVNNAS